VISRVATFNYLLVSEDYNQIVRNLKNEGCTYTKGGSFKVYFFIDFEKPACRLSERKKKVP